MNQMHEEEFIQRLSWKFHENYRLKTVEGPALRLYNQNLKEGEPRVLPHYTIVDIENGTDLDIRLHALGPSHGVHFMFADVIREFSKIFFGSELHNTFQYHRDHPNKPFMCEGNNRLDALNKLHECLMGRAIYLPVRRGDPSRGLMHDPSRLADNIFSSSTAARHAQVAISTWGIANQYVDDFVTHGMNEFIQIEHGHYYVDELNKVASVYILSRNIGGNKQIKARSTYVLETLMDDQDEDFELFNGADLFDNKKASKIKSLLLEQLDQLVLKEVACKKPETTQSPSAD